MKNLFVNTKLFWALTIVLLFGISNRINAQTTVTITCTGSAGSFNSGSVSSSGTKNDGNMVNVNSGANRGWAHFNLTSIPAGSNVTSVTANFTTYSSTSSVLGNNLYGFTGNPASIAGATLYANCASGSSFNNTSWSANAANSKAFNAAGEAFIAANCGTNNANIGYVRGSTNNYNIGGYPGSPAAPPTLVITYIPPCTGTPTAGTASASPLTVCQNASTTLSLTGYTTSSGITFQWKKSNVSGGPYSNIPGATTVSYNYSPSNVPNEYIVCQVTCTNSTLSNLSNEVTLSVNALPIVSVAPTSSFFCSPGGTPVTLNASGAISYSWSPTTGLSPTSGATVNASPSASTTYVATGTDGNGCTATASSSVTVVPAPTVNLTSSPGAICPGQSSTLNVNAVQLQNFSSGTIGLAIPDNNPTGASTTIVVSGAGILNAAGDLAVTLNFGTSSTAPNREHTYSGDVKVSIASPGGTTIVFDRPGNPASSFGNAQDLNGSYTFKISAAAILPQSGSGNIPNGNYKPSNSANPDAAHNWTGLSFPFNGNGNWTLTISDHASGDVGDLVSWSLQLPVAGNYAYSFSGPGTIGSTGCNNANCSSASASVSNLNPGTNNYSVITTTPTGCSATANASVILNPAPSPNASTNAPVCIGETLTLNGSNTASGQSSGNTYQWSGPNGYSSTLQNPSRPSSIPSYAGIYTLTVTNSFGCTQTTTVLVEVNDLPSVSIASQSNVSCFGFSDGSVDVDASGVGPFTYNLGPNFNFDGIFTNLTANTYNVVVTDDGNGCTNSQQVIISQPQPLTVSPGSNSPVCPSATLNLSALVSGGTSGYGYNWSGPNGFTSASANPSIPNPTSANAGSYTVTVTDNNSCVTTSSTSVNISQEPTAAISGTSSACLGNPASVTLTFTGSGPWNYSISGNGGPFTGSSSANTTNVNVIPSSGGTHNYVVASVSDVNCPGSGSGNATVVVSTAGPSNSVQAITIPDGACLNDVFPVTVNTVNGQNIQYSYNTGSSSSSVTWSNDLGGPFVASPFVSTQTTVYAKAGVLGNGTSGYNICIRGFNACGTTNNKCRLVRGKVSTPSGITGSTVQCTAASGQNYSITNPAYSVGAQKFNWSFSVPGAVITPANPPLSSNVSIDFPAFTTGQLCVTASLSCMGTSVSPPRCITISNSTADPANISGPGKICPGQVYTFTSSPAVSGAVSYNWVLPSTATIVNPPSPPYGSTVDVQFPSSYNQVGASANLSVSTSSVCNASSATRTKNIISIVPNTPSNITTSAGVTSGYCNSPGVFSVSAVSGVTYNWTFPPNVTANSANGNNSISLQFPFDFVSGVVSVNASLPSCAIPSGSRTISLTGAPATTGSIIPVSPPCNFGLGTFNTSFSNGATNYLWTVPANGTTIDAQNNVPPNPSIDVTWGNGSGQITVKAQNTCGFSQPKFLNYVPPCRISSDNSLPTSSFTVYPNPASDKATLLFESERQQLVSIRLLDMTGREAAAYYTSVNEGVHSVELSLQTVAKGVYTIELLTISGIRKTRISVQ